MGTHEILFQYYLAELDPSANFALPLTGVTVKVSVKEENSKIIPFRPDKIDPPKFVEKDAEKAKISLVDDENDSQTSGKKAKINCEEKDWTLKLPPIIGEDKGEKFSIIVNTG